MRVILLVVLSLALTAAAFAVSTDTMLLEGQLTSTKGQPVSGATIQVGTATLTSDAQGRFATRVPAGRTRIAIRAENYSTFNLELDLESDRELNIKLQSSNGVSVHAGPDILTPDPAAQAYARDDLLQANPGRPGVPLSVPGVPTETASGGVKAPQYFAPGVAGDHGEPIAQFFQIGGFLFPNNLSANAHGNGYADPNIVIPQTVSGVLVDDGAYNARYGDHSVNLAVTYELPRRVTSSAQITTDGRDADISAAWSPKNQSIDEWLAFEASVGNGFLGRPEARQQYKLNAARTWSTGKHEITAFGLAYYGFSRIPGLIPLDAPVIDDTIDPRQSDLTHTTVALFTDSWRLSDGQQLQLSGYFRTYSLELKSNFGDGLIRQSEFRTVGDANATWNYSLRANLMLLAGADFRRDAPRNLDLAKADHNGNFHLATSNDLTITSAAPFVAVNANLSPWIQVYAGVRHDQISFDNADRINTGNSFNKFPGVTSPKATLTLGRADAPLLPSVALSFGEAFHVNDPRIGAGSGRGDLIIRSRAWQLITTKIVAGTQLRLTLGRVSSSGELAKISPDTGLQEDVGPSLNRFLTLSALRRYSRGFVQLSWSQADARDREIHRPIPEAPRFIVDAVATLNRLPFALQAKSEFEYVGEKPLGENFRSIPVREIRFSLLRPFADGRILASVNGLLANGYTGQTLETLALPGEPSAFERRVGVPLRSYAGVSVAYIWWH